MVLDRASLDLTEKGNTGNFNNIAYPHLNGNLQIEHAEKIGLGSSQYELIEIG